MFGAHDKDDTVFHFALRCFYIIRNTVIILLLKQIKNMNGISILLLLFLTVTLPAIIVFFWLRSRKLPITLPWFLFSLSAGIVSFIVAAIIQALFAQNKGEGVWPVLFNIFIRIALVEEASRIIAIIPFFKAAKAGRNSIAFGAAIGLTAGLGFAAIESAYYGIANLNIALLRVFTAVPLHAACGIRAGTAVFAAPQHPAKAFSLFISSVFIHGAYNLMIVNPAIPSLLAIPTALIAFFASMYYLSDTNP
jgi:RsiW-degrading membrane proteinase PrsW (M82 family)